MRWYKSIYEMMPSDKPADDIIEDDERLDRWFEAYLRDLARKSGAKSGDSRFDLTGEAQPLPSVIKANA